MTTIAELTIKQVRELAEKATHGPWRFNFIPERPDHWIEDPWIIDPPLGGNGPVAEVEGEDNARLIAAAPDLARLVLAQAEELARLREVLAWFADEKNWYGLPDFESGWFCPASVEGRGRARAATQPAVSTGTRGQS